MFPISQIETHTDEFRVYGETSTYFHVIKSPLIPVIIEGSATKVTRGWNQIVEMNPEFYSVDPDEPASRVMP